MNRWTTMKIVFFGYDYTLDIAQRLIADGHEIMRIYTFPCDNAFAFNTQLYELAKHFNIEISESEIKEHNIDALISNECEIFICAGYPHKIPFIDNEKSYAINIHPTLLPRVRGIMPLPYVIMKEHEAAGFTVHKLTSEFDSGDILYSQAIPIDKTTDVETLAAKIAVQTPDAISNIINNIEKLWKNAAPQNEAESSSYGVPNEEMRSINWDDSVDQILLKTRAFGRYGVTATITNDMGQAQNLAIFQLSAWEEDHGYEAGKLLRSSSREIIMSIKGGFACLKEFQVIE